MAHRVESRLLRSLEHPELHPSTQRHHAVGVCIQPLAKRSHMTHLRFGLLLALASMFAHAQRALDPAPLPRHQLASPSESTKSAAEPNEANLTSHRNYGANGRVQLIGLVNLAQSTALTFERWRSVGTVTQQRQHMPSLQLY